jgi:signal transduction histidine kinase
MNPTLTALVLHDLKNALGSLEEQLSRLSVLPNTEDASAAHHQCQELRLRFVQWLTVEAGELNDGQGLPVWCEDESPEELLQAAADRAKAMRPDLPAPRVHHDAGPMPACWYFDRRLVSMALDAAIHNAQRFARKQVWLRSWTAGNTLHLAVDDDGPGLQESNGQSTGLGLTLCASVAKAHRRGQRTGTATAQTRPDGGGTRFELTLP